MVIFFCVVIAPYSLDALKVFFYEESKVPLHLPINNIKYNYKKNYPQNTQNQICLDPQPDKQPQNELNNAIPKRNFPMSDFSLVDQHLVKMPSMWQG